MCDYSVRTYIATLNRKIPLFAPEMLAFVRPIMAAEIKTQKLFPFNSLSAKVGVSLSGHREGWNAPQPMPTSAITEKKAKTSADSERSQGLS